MNYTHKGVYKIYDYEHVGDFEHPEFLLLKTKDVKIIRTEGSECDAMGYIYFKCTAEAKKELLINDELKSDIRF